ncbi:hypothetical protein ACHAXR_004937, partial [Thalassiosira sp. AJA248-18]
DEYWQTLEPAYCLVFGSADDDGTIINHSTSEIFSQDDQSRRQHGCALTWEWTRRWTPPPSSDESPITLQSTTAASTPKRIAQNAQILIEQALHGPVRSYISILPTYCYYLACRSLFHWADDYNDISDVDSNDDDRSHVVAQHLKKITRRHATYLISKGPALLHAILVAAPTDLSVWLIASRMNNLQSLTTTINKDQHNESYCRWQSWPYWALLCSITSWFHGYALVRTYANSVETMCLLVGIALLGPELFGQSYSEQDKENGNPPRYRHRPQAKLAFILGGLSACVRFTSLAAWITVGLIITIRSGMGSARGNSYRNMLDTLIGLCVTYGLIGVILGCCIDCWFYGIWAIPFLGNIHFNVWLGHGSLYGTHPFLWYAYAGIPAICGIMLPFFVWELAMLIKSALRGVQKTNITNLQKERHSYTKTNEIDECHENSGNPRFALLGVVTPYIFLHSFSEHKEFRFLLPILPLVCILAGHAMARLSRNMLQMETNDDGIDSSDSSKHMPALKTLIRNVFTSPKWLMAVALILLNYPHLCYLGFIHQRGPIAVNRYLASVIDTETRRRNKKIQASRQYSIHYLMGCHSAPLYSHLHIPGAFVNAWYLDCSPECRSNTAIVCESDAFSRDPLGFAMSVYGIPGDYGCTEVDVVREPPSYLVIMQDDALGIGNVLTEELKMSHVASIQHTVKSLSWHRHSDCDKSLSRVVTLFSLIDIHFDHMEVYKGKVS